MIESPMGQGKMEIESTICQAETDDVISRQAAIDALKPCAGVGNRALDKLRALPTVDAVEVVRCKDCKFFKGDGLECHHSGMFAYEDDYCSNGERKEADG